MLHTKHYSADKINKNEIGGECGTCGGEDSCTHGFSGANLSDQKTLGKHGLRKSDGRECSPNMASIAS
jgi:hypothetical protein